VPWAEVYFILNFLLTMLPFFLWRVMGMLASLVSLGFFFLALLRMYKAFSHGRFNLSWPISRPARDAAKRRQGMNRGRRRFSSGRLHLVCGAAAFCALLLSCTGAGAQALFRPFSADQIHTVGKKTTTGKVYAIEKALRTEAEQNGKKSISIMRFDRKVMWILMPDQKMYLEMGNFGAGVAELASTMQGSKVDRTALGSEQVGAYHCDKSRVQVTYEGKQYTSIEWAAKELNGFVVKRQSEKGDWSTEYQNVQLGPQNPSLFEIPAGYQKLNLGGMRMPQ